MINNSSETKNAFCIKGATQNMPFSKKYFRAKNRQI